MKALLTGSGGLIGSQCARTLAADGWDVVGVDNDLIVDRYQAERWTSRSRVGAAS